MTSISSIKRNYIVDYLKSLAIVLVVVGHVIDFSGLLKISLINSPNFEF